MNEPSITTKIVYKEIEAPPPLPKSIIKTDSSTIETKYYESLNSIREFNELNSSNDYYYTEYRFTNKTIIETGLVKDGNSSGIWKYYDERGRPQKEINFDTGEKKLFHGKTEPYDKIFIQVKSKADSLLINHFGADFFYQNIKWDVNQSYYFSTNNSGSWFSIPKELPEEFKFRYFILLDTNYRRSSIEFTIDSKGKMIDEKKSEGLKICSSAPCLFTIDYQKAIQIAKRNGIVPSKNPDHFYLEWNKAPDSYLGDYQLVILELKRKKQLNKRVSFYYYDGIILNPWNGEVIRKNEFLMEYSETRHCSYSSGIFERKDQGIFKKTFNMMYNQSLSVL